MATIARRPVLRSWQYTTCSYASAPMRSKTFTTGEGTAEGAASSRPPSAASADRQGRLLMGGVELAVDLEDAGSRGLELQVEGLVRLDLALDLVALDGEAVNLVRTVPDLEANRVLLVHRQVLGGEAGGTCHEGGCN